MRIIYSDDVFAELVNISYTIALDDESVAQKFLDACDETFQLLAQNPLIGAKREFHNPLLQDIRIWRVKGYEKYLIFYQPLSDGIKILHVVHGARNWKTLFDDIAKTEDNN